MHETVSGAVTYDRLRHGTGWPGPGGYRGGSSGGRHTSEIGSGHRPRAQAARCPGFAAPHPGRVWAQSRVLNGTANNSSASVGSSAEMSG